mgnify:CR=1 FL=1
MRVSVIICAYDVELYPHVREAAEGVLGQTHDDIELILIVDGDEKLYRKLEADFGDRDDVQLLLNDENIGLSASRNRGIEVATGDVVAFLDDDAVPEPDWVETLVGGYERHDALAVGGRMTPIWLDGKPTYLPSEFYWLIGVTHEGHPETEQEVRNTFGSNISFRRTVLEELGGFDEQLGRTGAAQLQGEETELADRLYEEYGERVWYLPDAEVGHKIFPYRLHPTWLLSRAFWQGYSKQKMEQPATDAESSESAFLRHLLVQSIPRRLRDVVSTHAIDNALQLAMLLLLTGAVGFGYLYGVAHTIATTNS